MDPLDSVIENLREKLQSEANIKAAFGDPLQLENHKIIPVAKLTIQIGGQGTGSGAGSNSSAAKSDGFGLGSMTDKLNGSKGAGFGTGSGNVKFEITPIGYIYEKSGIPSFTMLSFD